MTESKNDFPSNENLQTDLNSNVFKTADDLTLSGTPFVLITLLSTRGHAPQNRGAKCIVTSNGLISGTIGGGKVEAKAIEFAKLNFLYSKNTSLPNQNANTYQLFKWNLQKDVGMSCGGEVEILFEFFQATVMDIVIFGAGHVAQSLVRALLPLKCKITCMDSRKEWLLKLPVHPKVTPLQTDDLPSDEIFKLFHANCYFITMTKGHSTDAPILQKLFQFFKDAKYIGCMGSPVKAIKLKKELKDFGLSDSQLQTFHCPIGIQNIGSNEPEEISISIIAQLLQIRDLQNSPSVLIV